MPLVLSSPPATQGSSLNNTLGPNVMKEAARHTYRRGLTAKKPCGEANFNE